MTDLSPEARALIEATRDDDGPSDEQRARVRGRLAAALGATAAGTASAGAAAATQPAALAGAAAPAGSAGTAVFSAKLLSVLALGGIATATSVGVWQANEAMRRPTSTVVAAKPLQHSTRDAVPASAAEKASLRAPSPIPRELPQPPQVDQPAQASVAPAPARAPSLARAPSPAPALAPAPATPLAPSIERELALIGAAQLALREGDPNQALALLQQHTREFPDGALTQERLAARAIALCRIGDYATGRSAAEDLARRAPSSPLLARARQACDPREQP